MHIEVFGFCHSSKPVGHLLDVNGLFSIMSLPEFPAQIAELPVIARLRFEADELGQHQLRMVLLDEDHKLLGPPIESPFEAKADPEDLCAWVNMSTAIPNLRLGSTRPLLLQLHIDDKLVAEAPLFLKRIAGVRSS